MTHDILQCFIFENEPIRGEYIKLQDSFKTVLDNHAYPEPVRRLLGEGLCAAVLLSAIIKFEGRVTLQFRGKGKLQLLLAQCDDKYQMRGLAKYEGTISSYQELVESFKDGVLVIMLDSGIKGQRYQGVVEWKGNSLAETIEHYFHHSEQLATKIWLSVSEQCATGFLLQIVPIAEQAARGLEEEIILPSWHRILGLTNTKDENMLLTTEYPALLTELYPEETIRVFEGSPVQFHCSCNRKRCSDAISLLGRDEAEEELNNKQCLVVTCDFCNKEYVFDRVDVEAIFKNQKPPTDHIH